MAEEIRKAGGRAVVKMADVADPDAAAALIAAAVEAFGRLDILVNNAGVRREIDFADLDYREWREIVSIDSRRRLSVQPRRAAASHRVGQRRHRQHRRGVRAIPAPPRRAHVIAAKAGVAGLTRALAHDLAPHGITVNCVAPGMHRHDARGQRHVAVEPAHHARQRRSRASRHSRRRWRRSCVSCAARKRATSPARPFTPTAACSWASRQAIARNPLRRSLGVAVSSLSSLQHFAAHPSSRVVLTEVRRSTTTSDCPAITTKLSDETWRPTWTRPFGRAPAESERRRFNARMDMPGSVESDRIVESTMTVPTFLCRTGPWRSGRAERGPAFFWRISDVPAGWRPVRMLGPKLDDVARGPHVRGSGYAALNPMSSATSR